MTGISERVVKSPDTYNPEFCESIRVACAVQLGEIKGDVKGIRDRFWSLMVVALIQLCALVGALGYFILDHVDLVSKVEAYSVLLNTMK